MFAIVDLETTGGKPSHDRITEIAILIHNGKRVIESYTSLINPGRPIDPFVSALTNITDEMVADAPSFEEVAKEVHQLTKDKIFVAHNVRFDYGMLRAEYRRLGQNFHRKQLCTVRLAQKIMPDLNGYSLGRLCESLEIPIGDRHRAFGDAEATAVLFEKLLMNDRREIFQSELKEGLEDSFLPPHIKRAQVEAIPDEAGVYYFKDERGKPLYIGKSNNMRKRVISHFSSDLHEPRFLELKEKVRHLDFELTGNELVAMLLESDEIKRWMPPFNKAQRRVKYRMGIFQRKDEKGFLHLSIESLKEEERPVIKASTRRAAERIIERLMDEHELRNSFALIPQLKKSADLNGFLKSHNKKVQQALKRYQYRSPSFFIIDNGVRPDEHSVVWVEDNQYKGFGFFNPEFSGESPEVIKENIAFKHDNPDIHRIIRGWMRKKKKSLKIIKL